MSKTYTNNKTTYELIIDKMSDWVRVNKNGDFMALCWDKESAYQNIYQDVHSDGGKCEFLTDADFEAVK